MSTDSGFYQAYADHARILRTWLVTYGIGAPVLLLTNDRIAESVGASGYARTVALCFLIGVALQVMLAAVNKAAMWMLYRGEDSEPFKSRRRYRFASWLSDQFLIDLVVDGASIALFVFATFLAFDVAVAG